MRPTRIYLVCALLLSGTLVADRRIPGIDPIEQARPEPQKTEPAKTEPKKNEPAADRKTENKVENKTEPKTENKTEPKTEPEEVKQPARDLIRNIRGEKDVEHPYSARITWEVDPSNDTEIYIVRYVRPPATRALVLEAESLANPPLGPKEAVFLDRNMPEGSYYYAIVTGYQMSKRATLAMKPEQNYTSKPFILRRRREMDDQPAPQNPILADRSLQVQGLNAAIADGSVKLNWLAPANAGRISYNVYRSERPMNTADSLSLAQRLGSITDDRLFFEDSSPLSDRPVYYGVTVQDRDSAREFRTLTEGSSYIKVTYRRVVVEADIDNLLPRSLVAYHFDKNTVKLLWVDPPGAVSGYQVYRSNRPIVSTVELDRAYLIGRANRNDGVYVDARLSPGMYFYAVVPMDSMNRPVRALVEGRTFTGFGISIRDLPPVDQKVEQKTEQKTEQKVDQKVEQKVDQKIEPEVKPARMTLFRGSVREDSVGLTWAAEEVSRGDRFLVYRAGQPLLSIADVRAFGQLVTEAEWDARQYTDVKPGPGRHYYAVLLLHAGRVGERMEEGRNYLPLPAVIRGTEPEKKDEPVREEKKDQPPRDEKKEQRVEPVKVETAVGDINLILARTFEKGKFEECIQRLAPYRREGQAEEIRARAFLYTGISYFKLGQVKTARTYFVEPALRKQFPDRANFWYKRSLERGP